MTRLPSTPTGLPVITSPQSSTPSPTDAFIASLLQSPASVIANPYVPGSADFNPAQSIAAAAEANPDDPEYQEMLGRALYASTGLPQAPTTNREAVTQDARHRAASGLVERWRTEQAKVAMQLSDPRLGVDEQGRRAAMQQVDQRWMQQIGEVLKPSAVDAYKEFERQDKPEVRAIDMADTAQSYMQTGKWGENFSAIFSPDIPIKDSIEFITGLSKARKESMEGSEGVSAASKNAIINNIARLADDVQFAQDQADVPGANAALTKYQVAVRAAIDTGVISPTEAPTFTSADDFSADREMNRLLLPAKAVAPPPPPQVGPAPSAVVSLQPSTAASAQDIFTARTPQQAQGIIERARERGRKSVSIRDASTNQVHTINL